MELCFVHSASQITSVKESVVYVGNSLQTETFVKQRKMIYQKNEEEKEPYEIQTQTFKIFGFK